MNAVRSRGKLISRREEGICFISFDFSRTEGLNVSTFFEDLASALEQAIRSSPAYLVIEIAGFRSLTDLQILEEEDFKKAFECAERSSRALIGMKIPLIGIIKGLICGPLLETVLFLDFLIASRGAKLSSLMLERGYMPHMGMLTNMLEIVGQQALYAFILDGIDLSAAHASTHRITYRTVDDDQLYAERDSLLKTLSKKEMYPVRLIKELAHHNRNICPANADILERYSFALCFSESKFKENINLFLRTRTRLYE